MIKNRRQPETVGKGRFCILLRTACETILCLNGIPRAVFLYVGLIFILFGTYAAINIYLIATCSSLPPDQSLKYQSYLRKEPKSVAILIQATGKYLRLGQELIDSGRKLFCQSIPHECSNVTYILFTDHPSTEVKLSVVNSTQNVVVIPQPRLGWPHDSMKRFHIYLKQHELLKKHDYILAMDADLRFVAQVSLSEIFGDLVAVLHPGYFRSPRDHMPYEKNEPRSKAYVSMFQYCRYYTAAIWGGKSHHFIKAIQTLVWQLDEDVKELGVNFTAAWHDESHLNRYFIGNIPTRVLYPCYYNPYPNPFDECETKIAALDKNHAFMRSNDIK